MSDDCYWYTEGKCFLNEGEMPEQWIRNIIKRSPDARKDVVNCAMKKGKCDAVPDQYIEWANTLPDIESAEEFNNEFQKFINRFIDTHRFDDTFDMTSGEGDDHES